MKPTPLVMLLFATLIGGAAAAAPLPKDATARVEEVGDGVYAILHDDATDEWPHGNTGVIIGDDGVLVVDSTYLPSRARADIALIKALTKKPVKWLTFTHWHFDHNNGTVAYRDAWPAVTILGERESARWIELNQVWWAKMSTADGSTRRAGLAKLEAELAAGKDEAGKPLSAEDRKKTEKAIAQRKGEQAELATLKVVAANRVFDGETTLQVGKHRVVLHDWGKANSPHDVTIYLPDEKILFAGDILVQSPCPYTGASWPVPWAAVLRGLEALPVTSLVPGHGPVMKDHAYTRQVRELVEGVATRVEAMVREGKTLDQIQAGIKLDDLRKGVWVGAPEEDWKYVTTTLVERAWRGVRGQG